MLVPDDVLSRGLVVRHYVHLEEGVHHVLGVQLTQHPETATFYSLKV